MRFGQFLKEQVQVKEYAVSVKIKENESGSNFLDRVGEIPTRISTNQRKSWTESYSWWDSCKDFDELKASSATTGSI